MSHIYSHLKIHPTYTHYNVYCNSQELWTSFLNAVKKKNLLNSENSGIPKWFLIWDSVLAKNRI